MRLRLDAFDFLLACPPIRSVAARSHWLFSGECLHRAGLRALACQRYATAAELLEGAAVSYRERLMPEPLARARVHQLMARACAGGGRASPLSLEVDRALTRLQRIESPVPPFAMVPAHVLLASWLESDEPSEIAGRLAA
ncbi:MAG TPA: hypothetical protein VMS88_07885 [Terriglobales bacterium]|nr:hypothetical protein [Terriglobales bacterium]